MPSYLVEAYLADSDAAFAEERERARQVAELVPDVRWLRTTFVPDDETILHLFEAPSLEALTRATGDSGLRFERVVEVVEDIDDPRTSGTLGHQAAARDASTAHSDRPL